MGHKQGMQRLIAKGWKKGLVIFAGLVLFHITFSILLSIIARSSFLSSLHNGQGLWNFTLDSFAYHDEAVRLLELFRGGDYAGWWQSSPWWHVKWIGLSYAVLTPDPLSYAPINGLTWAVSVACIFMTVRQIFPDRRKLATACALMFGLWPSYLLHTSQLLKDPLYIMGMSMMFWGCVNLLSGQRTIISVFLIVFGVLIAYLNRTYMLEPLIFLSLLAAIFGIWQARGGWVQAVLAVLLIVGLGVYGYTQRPEIQIQSLSEVHGYDNRLSQPQEEILSRSQDSSSSPLIRLVNRGVIKIAYFRERYIRKYPNAGTNIDTDVHFYSLADILAYVPRASIIGFLAPFPSHWIGVARTAGRASRILAGLEMMVWYILLPGFVYFLFSETVAPHIRIWMLVYTLTLVVLTSLVVTNIGALYRLRYVYFLPILIGGLEGWARLWFRKFQKFAD